jgi:zinc transporter ZupT
VGVSFSGRRGWAQGTLVTLAIGLHNVPEGLAVATVMSARGAHPGPLHRTAGALLALASEVRRSGRRRAASSPAALISRPPPPPAGATPYRALMWTVLSSLPQAVVAVPSYLFVEAFTALLPVALGFAAGSMLWIVFAELMPEALEQVGAACAAGAA